MKFIRQSIPDIVLLEPQLHRDNRGYFFESFKKKAFEEFIGMKINFIQENESKSEKNVLRGLHYQTSPFAQSKLVRVLHGKVLDIALDIRRSSPTFGQHVAVELSEKNKLQMFIPKGFAHAFVVLSNSAVFSYKVDVEYAPDYERGIAYDDPNLGIDWIIPKQDLIISSKDSKNQNLSNIQDLFD